MTFIAYELRTVPASATIARGTWVEMGQLMDTYREQGQRVELVKVQLDTRNGQGWTRCHTWGYVA